MGVIMTIKRLCSALALTLICTVSTLYPYIYKGMIWRNKKANGEFQYVFGAADYHVANKRVTRAQKSRVSSAFRSYILKKQKIKAIVEDIDSYDGKDASVKAFDEIQNKNKKKGVSDSFLGGLYQKLKKMNIPVCNVECRHAKTLMCDLLEIGIADDISLENIPAICALGQQAAQKLGLEFKELSKHQIINAICQAYNIKIRNITDELKCCMHQLKSYKDSKVLNSCYKSIGHSIMAEGKKIISAGLHLSDLGKTP